MNPFSGLDNGKRYVAEAKSILGDEWVTVHSAVVPGISSHGEQDWFDDSLNIWGQITLNTMTMIRNVREITEDEAAAWEEKVGL